MSSQTCTGPAPTESGAIPLSAGDAEFDLDVRLLEVADPAGLINVTDDGCGSTCGACSTGAA
jgi:FxLD family lantipeptide